MGPPCSEAFVLQPPVWYPVLPYLTTIFGGLARRVVLLQGTVAAGAKRFHVSFQCGCSLRPRPDVAVGLCLRFGARARLVCAVREAGRWRGAVRLPRLALRPGDAVLLLFRFQQDHVQPFDASQATCPTAQPLLPVQTQLAMPYSHPLPHGLTPGSTVIVWATVAEEPEHFSLSLRAAPPEPGLVLAACFRTGALTWCQGPGEAHEVLDGFPFHARRFFQVSCCWWWMRQASSAWRSMGSRWGPSMPPAWPGPASPSWASPATCACTASSAEPVPATMPARDRRTSSPLHPALGWNRRT
ncbi:galectin-12 isoform X3 [Alligator mississippiensis]|uniref:galectin-12 isoform X3 n=1 Tax=Alligator mississippiensis TaxID=8496 RepID=UPI002877DDF3|nr:galectin-12 isoform X3 [Alligator mississippiensis]